MEENENKLPKPWGGKRRGAGRKPKKDLTKNFSVRVDAAMLAKAKTKHPDLCDQARKWVEQKANYEPRKIP